MNSRDLVLVATFVATARGLVLPAAPAVAPAVRPCARSPAARIAMAAAPPPSEASTLTELRAYVKETGLQVKTSGPGRSKEAILKDVLSLLSASEWRKGGPSGADDAPPPAAAAAEPEPQPEPEPEPAAPDGFEWGGTY